MPNQQFTLIVEGADLRSRAVVDALFDAGCDDATIGSIDDTHHIDFAREAASWGEAVLSAVQDVRKVEGLRVTRVVDVGPDLAATVERGTGDSFSWFLTMAAELSGLASPRTDPHRLRLSSDRSFHPRSEAQAAESAPLVPAVNASLELLSRLHHSIPAALPDNLRAQARALVTATLSASA